ncbi:hypothetical protein [uncultured Fibrobacter sp.]|uniref:hypothetical protein n=1 Tax=uncultured Fibrobacter sp. TaxID=261512 RepID=UPI001B29014A|nr:hypothetical protein [uncultured Fibrobacter sp.]MBO7104619.1 hypothetical protein [Fibrobacter sp.]
MLVAMGIVGYGEKVLMRRRQPGSPYAGTWEFPAVPLDFGDTLERALEEWVFESSGVRAFPGLPEPAFCCRNVPGFRFFPVKMGTESPRLYFSSPNFYKWLKIKELHNFRLSPPTVMYVKQNKKICF